MGATNPIIFNLKAKIGNVLVESFYKKMGKKLGAKIHNYNGKTDIEWSSIKTGKSETLLFLHGFSDRKENFYFASKSLKEKFDIIIPDMPAFGKSTVDKKIKYSLENYCEWLADFIENTDIKRFHLVGSSLGGAVAVLLAIKFPDRVKSLSLVGSAGFYMSDKKSIYDEALNGQNLFQIDTPEEYERFRDRIFKNKITLPNFVKEYMVKLAIDNRDWYGKIFNDLGDIERVKKKLKTIDDITLNSLCQEIKMPTMLFWGKHDTLFPCETADFLKGQIPNARAHIFEKLGHVPQSEDPQGFAKELSDFILSLE